MENDRLFQIISGHFAAGIIFNVKTKRCVYTAPIIKWMRGKTFKEVKMYCKRKGLKMRKVDDFERVVQD